MNGVTIKPYPDIKFAIAAGCENINDQANKNDKEFKTF